MQNLQYPPVAKTASVQLATVPIVELLVTPTVTGVLSEAHLPSCCYERVLGRLRRDVRQSLTPWLASEQAL